MPSSLISLGANLGNTLETMRAASRLVRDLFDESEIQLSSIFKTPPVGGPSGQGEFLNAIARLDHSLSVWEVWEKIKQIETQLGRQRFRRWESRRIDVDLILHDRELVWTPHLKVPHPRMSMRSFVIQPACQVASGLIDPVTGLTIQELSSRLSTTRPPCISVACSTEGLRRQLEESLQQLSPLDRESIELFWCPEPQTWVGGVLEVDLHIACVQVPDPESVQWEDYCLPWALAMGFTRLPGGGITHAERGSDKITSTKIGARYLMPGTDIDWVCHELQAACLALRCPVEPTGDSWIA